MLPFSIYLFLFQRGAYNKLVWFKSICLDFNFVYLILSIVYTNDFSLLRFNKIAKIFILRSRNIK